MLAKLRGAFWVAVGQEGGATSESDNVPSTARGADRSWKGRRYARWGGMCRWGRLSDVSSRQLDGF